MQSISALSLALDARDWLVNSRHPRILHVFDHACNLINECGEVLSVVTPQIGSGPFNLEIPGLRKSFGRPPEPDESQQTSEVFSNINLQSVISNSPDQLNLGSLTIHTAGAKLWHPRPDWEMLHARRADILNQIMSLRRNNLSANLEIASSQKTSALLATTFTNLQFPNSLASSLANADLPSSLAAAQQLAGLGIGLTPSGDDFMLGAVLAAWIIHPPEVARVLAEEITNTAAPLTTSLSAAYLKSAGKGEAGILWHNFFKALSIGDSSNVEIQISKLLSIGQTSGADALAGFMGTFISYAEIERNHVISKHF